MLITLTDILFDNFEKIEDSYIIRVGGDEFVIIALNSNNEQFIEIIKNTAKIISNTKLKYIDEDVSINISAGIYSEKNPTNFMKIYKKADSNLLKAKNAGKNK